MWTFSIKFTEKLNYCLPSISELEYGQLATRFHSTPDNPSLYTIYAPWNNGYVAASKLNLQYLRAGTYIYILVFRGHVCLSILTSNSFL